MCQNSSSGMMAGCEGGGDAQTQVAWACELKRVEICAVRKGECMHAHGLASSRWRHHKDADPLGRFS
eukprot:3894781-Pleurochrysis_carterae.AAC.2